MRNAENPGPKQSPKSNLSFMRGSLGLIIIVAVAASLFWSNTIAIKFRPSVHLLSGNHLFPSLLRNQSDQRVFPTLLRNQSDPITITSPISTLQTEYAQQAVPEGQHAHITMTLPSPNNRSDHRNDPEEGDQEARFFVGKPSPMGQVRLNTLKNVWYSSQFGHSNRTTIFWGHGGFGNTLNSFFSGAVYSMLSGREFMFDSIFNHLFMATELSWGWEPKRYPHAGSHKNFYLLDTCFSPSSSFPKQLMTSSSPDPWRQDVVNVSTNCPLYKFWCRNKKFHDDLSNMGLYNASIGLPASFQVAHMLSRLLLQPKGMMRDLVQATFAQQSRKIIGIQIRMGGSEIGDGAIFGPKSFNWAKHFFKCAKAVADELSEPGEGEALFYISTDRNSVIHEAIEFFGADLVMVAKMGKVLHTDRQGKYSASVEKEGIYRAALDSLYMGMYSDGLVITPGSTFGALAATASGKHPWYVVLNEGPNQFQCNKVDFDHPPNRYHLKDSSPL